MMTTASILKRPSDFAGFVQIINRLLASSEPITLEDFRAGLASLEESAPVPLEAAMELVEKLGALAKTQSNPGTAQTYTAASLFLRGACNRARQSGEGPAPSLNTTTLSTGSLRRRTGEN